jgi:hypothetical protein
MNVPAGNVHEVVFVRGVSVGNKCHDIESGMKQRAGFSKLVQSRSTS